MGVADWRIVLRHIIPGALGPVIVQMTLDVGTVILEVAGLTSSAWVHSRLRPTGLMISTGRAYPTAMVDQRLPRICHLPPCACLQLRGRWPARRARPTGQALRQE